MFESIGHRARIKKANLSLISGVPSDQIKTGHRFGWGVDSQFEVSEVGDNDVEIVRMASGGLTVDDLSIPNLETGGPVDTKFFEDRSVDTTEKPEGGYPPFSKKPKVGPRYRGGDVNNPANPAGGITETKSVMGPYPVSDRPLYPMRKPSDIYTGGALKESNGGNDMTRRPIEELLQGEIFSINSKAMKLVLASIDPLKDGEGEVVARTLEGESRCFSFADIRGHSVCVWGKQEEEKEELPEQFDRVAHVESGINGTVLSVNAENKSATVLWDSPIHNQNLQTEATKHLKQMGIKASGKQLDLSKKVATIIREGEQLSEMDDFSKGYKTIKEEVTKKAVEAENKVEAAMQKKVEDITKVVINANIEDFRRIQTTGVAIVTVGEHNYQIDEIAGYVRGYQDYILNRVTDTIRKHNITGSSMIEVPVTTGVMKIMADNMLNSYFMTRDGYIREERDKWAVYSKRHVLLGRFDNKKKALAQIRSREYRIRKGIEE